MKIYRDLFKSTSSQESPVCPLGYGSPESRMTSTSGQGDFLVPTSAVPEKGKGSRGRGRGYGGNSSASSRPESPVTSSLKMFLLSELAEQTKSSVLWKQQATPAGRSWLVLGLAEPRKSETASGSSAGWPTPSAGNFNDGESPETFLARRTKLKKQFKNGNGAGIPLGVAVKMWPTPRCADGMHHPIPTKEDVEQYEKNRGRKEQRLEYEVGRQTCWPTPQAHDCQGPGNPARVGRFGTKHGGRNLNDEAALYAGLPAPESPKRNGKSPIYSHYQAYIHEFGISWARTIRRWWNANERRTKSRRNWRPLPALVSHRLWSPWVAQLMSYPSDWCVLSTDAASRLTVTRSSPKSPGSSQRGCSMSLPSLTEDDEET